MSDTDDFEVVPLRAFTDNYIWTLRKHRFAAVVDPGDAQPVLDYLRREQLELCAILATHHHPDHVGGGRTARPSRRSRIRSERRAYSHAHPPRA
jgi:glyoxylase-like metal-dependent hydrolase (beta-lactamase superfamily II)